MKEFVLVALLAAVVMSCGKNQLDSPDLKEPSTSTSTGSEQAPSKEADRSERVEPRRSGKCPDGFTAMGKNEQGYDEYKHEKTGMVFVLISGGKFNMGSNDDNPDEKPVHEVSLDSFLISKYEVTQGVWQKILGKNPAHIKDGDDYPIESVTWNECQNFCIAAGLRLPSEAEWEYACRDRTVTKYYWGDEEDGDYMWYEKNSGSKTHPVGKKKPNGYGLYDMSGNVWEWCQDWLGAYGNQSVSNPTGPASGKGRCVRGGGCVSSAISCRSAFRSRNDAFYRGMTTGFRAVQDSK